MYGETVDSRGWSLTMSTDDKPEDHGKARAAPTGDRNERAKLPGKEPAHSANMREVIQPAQSNADTDANTDSASTDAGKITSDKTNTDKIITDKATIWPDRQRVRAPARGFILAIPAGVVLWAIAIYLFARLLG